MDMLRFSIMYTVSSVILFIGAMMFMATAMPEDMAFETSSQSGTNVPSYMSTVMGTVLDINIA